MKKFIQFNHAAIIMMTILVIVVIFHILVVIGIVPMEIVWGGRITTREKLLQYEAVSISINMVSIFFVLVKADYVKITALKKAAAFFIWILCVLFAINTVGNLFAVSIIEKIIFTPLTIVLSLLSARIAMEKN